MQGHARNAKDLLGPVPRQVFDHIGIFAATVIPPARIPLGVFVVKTDPAASSTASETKFSLAIISSPSCWRSVSCSMAAATSGSVWASGREKAVWTSVWVRSVILEF
jgi:hypothetical protein